MNETIALLLEHSKLDLLLDLLLEQYNDNAVHFTITCILALISIWLLLQPSYFPGMRNSTSETLTPKEIEYLIDEWQPEPLAPKVSDFHQKRLDNTPVVTSASGPNIVINGVKAINLASGNFLGLVGDDRITAECDKALRKYGCGSCGPRGFYGTIDVHLILEDDIANFYGLDEAILYSYGLATISSVIPAFSKRDDIIVGDAGVHHAVHVGMRLSRSRLIYYKHNDMKNLEKTLQSIIEEDKQDPSKPLTRRFIIFEGLSFNHGDIAPLPKIIELARKYKFRLIMEDSFGFGVLGKTGRGTCEHYGIKPGEVDAITASFGYAIASGGGFCTGGTYIVDHQRLGGDGYVFSASLPPYLAVAASKGMAILDEEPHLLVTLRKNAEHLYDRLKSIKGISVGGDKGSPVIHLYLASPSGDRQQDMEVLDKIVEQALKHKVALKQAEYIPDDYKWAQPSIRVLASAAHSDADIKTAGDAVDKAIQEVLGA